MAAAKGSRGRPVGGYIRVSRIGGRAGDGYISPKVQRESIKRYADELGCSIPADAWFDDQDYSGGNLDRPGWEALVARIEAGELDGVIVHCTDRFARNVPDGAAEIRRIVDERKALFGSAQERMDAATDQGRYMLQQFLNNAELQLNTLKSGWKRAKERAIARGAHIGPTPLGLDRIPKGEERSGTLVPKREWKPVIRRLFKRAAQYPSVGTKTLSNWANEKATRPDGKRWTATTVGHVLANRVYLGEVSYRPRNDHFEPLVNSDAHEAIIDEATWQAAQRQPGVQKTSAGPASLLSGLIRCAGCRYRMSASRGGKMIRVYRCIGEHGAGKCPAPAVITADKIEEWVVDQIKAQWQTRFELVPQSAHEQKDLDAAIAALEEAREELAAFAADTKARKMLGDAYHPAMEKRAAEVEAAQAEIRRLAAGQSGFAGVRIDWGALSRIELREVLAGAIDAVFIRQGRGRPVMERASIIWNGELDDDVPSRGRPAKVLRPFAWPEENQPRPRETSAQDPY